MLFAILAQPNLVLTLFLCLVVPIMRIEGVNLIGLFSIPSPFSMRRADVADLPMTAEKCEGTDVVRVDAAVQTVADEEVWNVLFSIPHTHIHNGCITFFQTH